MADTMKLTCISAVNHNLVSVAYGTITLVRSPSLWAPDTSRPVVDHWCLAPLCNYYLLIHDSKVIVLRDGCSNVGNSFVL